MTYSQAVNLAVADHDRLRRMLVPLAVAVLVITTACTAIGAHDIREFAVVMGIVVLTLAGVYGYLLPRALTRESAGGMALTFSVIAVVLLLPAFWAGLPLVLGVAGALLGYAGKNARSGAGRSVAAFVLGLLATVGYVAIYVLDTLAQHGIG